MMTILLIVQKKVIQFDEKKKFLKSLKIIDLLIVQSWVIQLSEKRRFNNSK